MLKLNTYGAPNEKNVAEYHLILTNGIKIDSHFDFQ